MKEACLARGLYSQGKPADLAARLHKSWFSPFVCGSDAKDLDVSVTVVRAADLENATPRVLRPLVEARFGGDHKLKSALSKKTLLALCVTLSADELRKAAATPRKKSKAVNSGFMDRAAMPTDEQFESLSLRELKEAVLSRGAWATKHSERNVMVRDLMKNWHVGFVAGSSDLDCDISDSACSLDKVALACTPTQTLRVIVNARLGDGHVLQNNPSRSKLIELALTMQIRDLWTAAATPPRAGKPRGKYRRAAPGPGGGVGPPQLAEATPPPPGGGVPDDADDADDAAALAVREAGTPPAAAEYASPEYGLLAVPLDDTTPPPPGDALPDDAAVRAARAAQAAVTALAVPPPTVVSRGRPRGALRADPPVNDTEARRHVPQLSALFADAARRDARSGDSVDIVVLVRDRTEDPGRGPPRTASKKRRNDLTVFSSGGTLVAMEITGEFCDKMDEQGCPDPRVPPPLPPPAVPRAQTLTVLKSAAEVKAHFGPSTEALRVWL